MSVEARTIDWSVIEPGTRVVYSRLYFDIYCAGRPNTTVLARAGTVYRVAPGQNAVASISWDGEHEWLDPVPADYLDLEVNATTEAEKAAYAVKGLLHQRRGLEAQRRELDRRIAILDLELDERVRLASS